VKVQASHAKSIYAASRPTPGTTAIRIHGMPFFVAADQAATRHRLLQARNEAAKSIATIDCGRM
jgi:hypothetical protein